MIHHALEKHENRNKKTLFIDYDLPTREPGNLPHTGTYTLQRGGISMSENL